MTKPIKIEPFAHICAADSGVMFLAVGGPLENDSGTLPQTSIRLTINGLPIRPR